MAERIDWARRNQSWSSRWGHVMDPKSVKVVPITKEEKAEIEFSQQCLPIGEGSSEILRKEIAEEMVFLNKFVKALKDNKLEDFEKEVDSTPKKTIKVKKTSKVHDLDKIKAEKAEEVRILEACSEEEDSSVEKCKRCNGPRVTIGQTGLHRC